MSSLFLTSLRSAMSGSSLAYSYYYYPSSCCCRQFFRKEQGVMMVHRRTKTVYQYYKRKRPKRGRPNAPHSIQSAMNCLQKAPSNITHGTVDTHGSYDVHVSLNLDPLYAPGHRLRGVCILPHGTGGTCRVAAMTSSKELAEKALQAGALHAGGDVLYKQIMRGIVTLKKIDRLIVSEEMADFCLHPTSEIRALMKSTNLRFLLPRKSLKTLVSTPEEFLESVTNYAASKCVIYRTSILGHVSVPLGKVRTHTAEMIEDNLKAFLRHLVEIRPDNYGQGRPGSRNCKPRNRGRYVLSIRMSRSFRAKSYPLQLNNLMKEIDPNNLHGIGPRIIPTNDSSLDELEDTDDYYLNDKEDNINTSRSFSIQKDDTPVSLALYSDDDDDTMLEEEVENHHDYIERDVLDNTLSHDDNLKEHDSMNHDDDETMIEEVEHHHGDQKRDVVDTIPSPETSLYEDEEEEEEEYDDNFKEQSILYHDNDETMMKEVVENHHDYRKRDAVADNKPSQKTSLYEDEEDDDENDDNFKVQNTLCHVDDDTMMQEEVENLHGNRERDAVADNKPSLETSSYEAEEDDSEYDDNFKEQSTSYHEENNESIGYRDDHSKVQTMKAETYEQKHEIKSSRFNFSDDFSALSSADPLLDNEDGAGDGACSAENSLYGDDEIEEDYDPGNESLCKENDFVVNAVDESTIRGKREEILRREFASMSKTAVLRMQSLIAKNKVVRGPAAFIYLEACLGAAAGSLAAEKLEQRMKNKLDSTAETQPSHEERIDDVLLKDKLFASVPTLELSQIMDMMLESDMAASKDASIRKGDKIIEYLASISVKQQQQQSLKNESKNMRTHQHLVADEVPALYDDDDDDLSQPLEIIS